MVRGAHVLAGTAKGGVCRNAMPLAPWRLLVCRGSSCFTIHCLLIDVESGCLKAACRRHRSRDWRRCFHCVDVRGRGSRTYLRPDCSVMPGACTDMQRQCCRSMLAAVQFRLDRAAKRRQDWSVAYNCCWMLCCIILANLTSAGNHVQNTCS